MKRLNVLDLAVGIEDSGAEFYSLAESRIKGETAKLFNKLSREEKHHAEIFKKLLKENGDLVVIGGQPYASLLRPAGLSLMK